MGKKRSTNEQSQVAGTWGSEIPDSGVATAPAAASARRERDPEYDQATKDAYTGKLPGYEDYRSANIDQYAEAVRESMANIDSGGARLPTDREPTQDERDAANAGYRANEDSKPRLATFVTAQKAEAAVATLLEGDMARRANFNPRDAQPLAADDPNRRATEIPLSQVTTPVRIIGVDYDSYGEVPHSVRHGNQTNNFRVPILTATAQIKIPARDYAQAFPEEFAAMNKELTSRGLPPVRANRQADVDAGRADRVDHVFHDVRIPIVAPTEARNVAMLRGGFPVVSSDPSPDRRYVKPVTNEEAMGFVNEMADQGIELRATNRVLREAVGLPAYGDINRREDGTMLPESERRTLPTLASFLDPANGFDADVVSVAMREAKGRVVASKANLGAGSVATVRTGALVKMFARSAGITTALQAASPRLGDGQIPKEPQGSVAVNRDHELKPSRRPVTPRAGGRLWADTGVHVVSRTFTEQEAENLLAKQAREQAARSAKDGHA